MSSRARDSEFEQDIGDQAKLCMGSGLQFAASRCIGFDAWCFRVGLGLYSFGFRVERSMLQGLTG